jgi:hypothetical protein
VRSKKMNNIRVTRILETAFSKEDAAELVEEFNNTETKLATKSDLKDLEIKLLKVIGSQTLILLGGFSIILTIFKYIELHR